MKEDLDRKEAERLRKEWSITVQAQKILESTRTGQWKIIGLLPAVETLKGKDGMRMHFVCLRCKAYLLGFRKTRRAEEIAFSLSDVPDYSGGWLVAPVRMDGVLRNRVFRCSCPVGRSLPAHIPFYDAQPEADPKATQEELTRLEWKLRADEEGRVEEDPERPGSHSRVVHLHEDEGAGTPKLPVMP